MRPLIGVTSYVEQARWGNWDRLVTLLPQHYVDAIHAAGGRALVIPPSPVGVAEIVAALDGLVFAGGVDIDPSMYGQERDPHTEEPRPDRDAGELGLLQAAFDADLPVLGICRGMEVMCVASGGSLIQHLPDAIGSQRHRAGSGVYAEHEVETGPGSALAEILGPTATVSSYHHQGVSDQGKLTVTAHADDGTIEGVERPDSRFAVGVLWHPEVTEDLRLFSALVAAAAR